MDQILSSIMNSQNTNTSSTLPSNPNVKDVTNLLSKQLTTNSSINNLIDNATKMVMCPPGSACEKQKISDELNRRYQDAQINEQVAPLRLANAKKYYYVYTEGRARYNDMLEKELQGKSELISKQIADKFNEEIQNANIMNTYFNITQVNSENTIELYEDYLKNNAEMLALIKSSHGDVLTNDRKTYYETEAIEQIKTWHTVIVSIYWILLVTFVLTIFLSPSNLSRKQQIVIVICLILYPFLIHKIIMYLYNYFTTTFIKNTETNIYMDL